MLNPVRELTAIDRSLAGTVCSIEAHETSLAIVAMSALVRTTQVGTEVPKLIDARLKARSESYGPVERMSLDEHVAPQLSDYREPAMSVTDRTTKTLDKVPLGKS